jgi:2-keto-3-deoxy-6-phosphogluconate aldolase
MKNRKNIKSVLLSTVFILTTYFNSFAQDATPPATVFGGSADLYYKYDFSGYNNSYTSFTKSHDSFELGMASIEASHKLEKASVFVDLGFGNRASEFTYNDSEATFMIKQLYVTYDFTPSFKVTAGSFTTHLGYELLDAVDNKNYSMSYAFTCGPFFNTGVKAQYTSGKYSFMLGVSNPTDFKTAAEAGSKQKTIFGQVAYTGTTGSAYFNFTSGSMNPVDSKNRTQFDFVGTKKLSDKLSLSFNGTYAIVKDDFDSNLDGDWFALVGYANYALKPKLNLAYRLEYFDDKDAVLGIVSNGNVLGNTLSLNFKEGNFTFIPEFRYDFASEDIFVDSNESPTGSSAYFLIATTYSF